MQQAGRGTTGCSADEARGPCGVNSTQYKMQTCEECKLPCSCLFDANHLIAIVVRIHDHTCTVQKKRCVCNDSWAAEEFNAVHSLKCTAGTKPHVVK